MRVQELNERALWVAYRIALHDHLSAPVRDMLSVVLAVSPSDADQLRKDGAEAIATLEAYGFISNGNVEKLEQASQNTAGLAAIHTITRKYEAEYAALHNRVLMHRNGLCFTCKMRTATWIARSCGHVVYCSAECASILHKGHCPKCVQPVKELEDINAAHRAAPAAPVLPPCKCCQMTHATYVLIPCGHLYCCDLCMVAGVEISCRVKGCSAAVERVQKIDLSSSPQ